MSEKKCDLRDLTKNTYSMTGKPDIRDVKVASILVMADCAKNLVEFGKTMSSCMVSIAKDINDMNKSINAINDIFKDQKAEVKKDNYDYNAFQALGWMHAECCSLLDAGKDPRKEDIGYMITRATKDLNLVKKGV